MMDLDDLGAELPPCDPKEVDEAWGIQTTENSGSARLPFGRRFQQAKSCANPAGRFCATSRGLGPGTAT